MDVATGKAEALLEDYEDHFNLEQIISSIKKSWAYQIEKRKRKVRPPSPTPDVSLRD